MDTMDTQYHEHNGIDAPKINLINAVNCPNEKLTAKDTNTPSISYGTQEQQIIINLQTRLNEVETILQKIGIIKQ